ncbi:ATP-binding protein [Candidatus Nitrosotenuis chungbukensis]|uniref:ATP-binding protein n=1 Tax=Candidatus Nitrosotenuis chungbukensis TaxID=1353246 RepID=UPI0005B2A48D|nr:ATP-binding protein [Candidatus Nitrosotenuis chungbukensis]
MSELSNLVDKAEDIGVVGSPSSTSHLKLDILGRAADKRLVGSMAVLKYTQDGHANYALGQITEVSLYNPFVMDPTMRSIIRQRGSVEPITERQDTHSADMLISAVFQESGDGLDPSSFSTVPSTGSRIKTINQDIVDKLVSPYSKEISYIGKIFGTDVLMPSLFRNFGNEAEGGLGEAMHIGVFGKSGSGKSFLGKMILASYMRHKQMTLLVVDPQGEFSKMKNDKNLMDYVEKTLGRKIEFYDLSKLVLLPEIELFKQILVKSKFLKDLGIKNMDNQEDGADEIAKILSHDWGHSIASGITGRINLWDAYQRPVFDHVWERLTHTRPRNGEQIPIVIERIYSTPSYRDKVFSDMQDITRNPERLEAFYQKWRKVTSLFGREGMGPSNNLALILKAIGKRGDGRIIIINLSEAEVPDYLFWNEEIKKVAINQILQRIAEVAKDQYNEGGSLNSLVVLDEAHEFAPRERTDEEEIIELRDTLTTAVRETRKYNLGWMFISQTLSSLDRRIIEQLRMYFIGYGLAYGIELSGVRELLAGNDSAIRLYQQFQDPKSSYTKPKYSFMCIGPSSPMSFSQIPLFLNSLNYPKEFLNINDKTN